MADQSVAGMAALQGWASDFQDLGAGRWAWLSFTIREFPRAGTEHEMVRKIYIQSRVGEQNTAESAGWQI